ncbi:hypothetical protein [Streptomyces sp. 135]|uniref:hypothetical protein n=1 Tax=Streptomyces sp. 135 TaxID=2838850 RepID=UPI001CBEBD53|nr:hypothetical protein [Streptomyces sp. 135]
MSQPRQKRERSVLRYQLPTVRTRFADQVKVMLAAGCHTGVFTSRQLEVPGVSDHRKGLVTAFLHSCGLLARGGGRGIYRATPAARRIAEAWRISETRGRRELANVLHRTWFARIARQELGEHGGQRAALANRLLAAARAPESRRGEVEILVMWLLEARLLLPVREGHVCWNADALAPVPAEATETGDRGAMEEDVAGANDGGPTVDDNFPRTSRQTGTEPASAADSSRVEGTGQEVAAEPVVDSVLSPDPRDPHDRPDTASSFEGPSPKRLPAYPYTTVRRAGMPEDEMLENRHAPDSRPTPDDEAPLRGDVIPPQAARNAETQSVRPTSQLTELAHLGEIAGRPIKLHELLQLTEGELLSMYRGLRRFVDITAGAMNSNTKP